MIQNTLDFLDDPLGCRDDLRDAWTDPDLGKVDSTGQADRDGARAAYRLALCLGRCRLFGVEPGDDLRDVLPLNAALAAAADLTGLLENRARKAASLGEEWEQAVDPAEADNLCAGLLNVCMEAWAIGIALDRAVLEGEQQGDARARTLAEAIDRCHEALDRFDEALEGQLEVLATIAHTHLLENWRALLAPAYRENLPWWLDGRLEEIATRLREEAVRTLPGPAAWSEARRRAAAAGLVMTAAFSCLLLRARRAGRAEVLEAPPTLLKWTSPEGEAAYLKLPREGETTLTVQFFTADRDPARMLDAQPVWLAGVPSEVREAKATFALAAVEEAGQDLRLEVGPERTTWQPDATNLPRGTDGDSAR
jgi:hypothetical protein